MALEHWGGDILRWHRACTVDDSGSTCAPQRFFRGRRCDLRRHFCRLSPDPDDTPLRLKMAARPRACEWPRPRAAIGDGDRGRALTIESQLSLTALDASRCEPDHIVT